MRLPDFVRSLIDEALEDDFETAVISRGKTLFRAGHVGEITHEFDALNSEYLYEAEVLGSTRRRYQTELVVDSEFHSVDANCTCFYGSRCKHAVALACSLLSGNQAGQQQALTSADAWLLELQASLSPAHQSTSGQEWQLSFLIEREGNTCSLCLVQRYKKRSGDWGRLQAVSLYVADRDRSCSVLDEQVVDLLRGMGAGRVTRVGKQFIDTYQLTGARGRQILEWALRSGHAYDAKTLQPLVWGESRNLDFVWEPYRDGERLCAVVDPEPEAEWQLLSQFISPLYVCRLTFGPLNTAMDPQQLDILARMPPVSQEQKLDITLRLKQQLSQQLVEEEDLPEVPTYTEGVPGMTLLGVKHPGSGYLPALRFFVSYGDWRFQPEFDTALSLAEQRPAPELKRDEDAYAYIVRDRAGEAEWARRLRGRFLVPHGYGADLGELWIPSEMNAYRHVEAWQKLLPGLQALVDTEGWQIELDDSYRLGHSIAQIAGEAEDAGNGWFDLRLNLSVGDGTLDTGSLMAEWIAAGTPDELLIKGDDDHWQTVDMRLLKPVLGLLTELYGGEQLDKPVRLPGFKAMELDALDDVDVSRAPALAKLRSQLRNFKGIKTVAPARYLRAELRDYQALGLNWLMFLHQYGFGGILADDMGLGKTLQTLAFLQRLKVGRKLTQGALVIAPTSLIWNWQREVERFTPNLTTLVLHGPEREEWFPVMAEFDLIITTYGVLHRDFDVHAAREYDVVVLDEAQKIKNSRAKTTRDVKQLPAKMRLCLTGTPLENHLGELWSIADFVLPGLLGSEEQFSKRFRVPIERDGDADQATGLSRRIAPFMLRRTKTEVVKELPPKVEMQQTVTLEGRQQALYESIRISMEKRVRDLIKKKGLAKSHIDFLDALLKLRQACIDPRLVKLKQAAGIKQSAKMQWLMESLPEMVEEGRKILLFSQFTTMLDLIETELTKAGIDSVKLTGRTRNRERVISAFQDGAAPMFLISLKAGGAGLNLTAADTVIHVDPWWNPAVENQATDRAYRIGQDKTVFVYKLVAAGTVEEKIQRLQESKQALADNLFDASKKVQLPGTSDELLALFE